MRVVPTTQETVEIMRWARSSSDETGTSLFVSHCPRPAAVHGANATGESLVSNGTIGADILRLPAGAGFPPHTHVGHHVLAVLGGRGTITYAGRVHPTEAGQIYLVEGAVSHAVGAITDHVILAVGAPHRPVDSSSRMTVVDYAEVLSPIGELTCLICDLRSSPPRRLHDVGCTHCPCHDCTHPGKPQRSAAIADA
jgi:quercetin dioxygenase-like cupin family protein